MVSMALLLAGGLVRGGRILQIFYLSKCDLRTHLENLEKQPTSSVALLRRVEARSETANERSRARPLINTPNHGGAKAGYGEGNRFNGFPSFSHTTGPKPLKRFPCPPFPCPTPMNGGVNERIQFIRIMPPLFGAPILPLGCYDFKAGHPFQIAGSPADSTSSPATEVSVPRRFISKCHFQTW